MKRNLIYVLTSNIINVSIGIAIGFVLPNLLTVDGFGYYQLFIFYSGYVGFFHFGFIDGIYLKYGGYNYEDINIETFRKYIFYLFFQQSIISILFIIMSYLFFSGDRQGIFVLVSINLFILNIITYFSFLSQIFKNFRLISYLSILIKTLNFIVIYIFIIFKLDNYHLMNIAITLLNVISLVILIYYYRKITFGKRESIIQQNNDIKEIYIMGFPLMIGNFIGILVVGIDAFIVDNLFGIDDFSTYSFAISVTSLLLIFVGSVSSVLYPYLSRINKDKYKEFYSKLANLSVIFCSLGLATYFILIVIVKAYLPKYVDSIMIFAFLIPAIVLRSFISLVTTNYYRILKLQKKYLVNNILALMASIIVFTVVLLINKSIEAVALGYLISHFLWFLYSDFYFSKINSLKFLKRFFYLIIIFSSYFIVIRFNFVIGITLFLLSY
ncbi:MAG: integral rane protein, partial [Haloplasmataceae bacterium]|nr:integral rane protein [Haloplasmataceae bacterium]